MDYTTLFPEQREAKAGSQKPAIALYEVCQQVLDGRAARGKRYELAALLVVLVLAKLAGMQSLLGASEWIQDQQERLCAHLRLPWKRMPCANTYKYVLARLDSQQVNAQFAAWLVRTEAQSRCGEEPSRLALQARGRSVHLAIDGKTLKGTGKQIYEGEEPQKQMLHVYEVQTGIVLEQCPIAQDHNEVSTLKPLLTEVLCKGRLITADAAQSYHEFGRLVQRAGGDVVMIIKGNTPATRADLELFFEDEQADRHTWRSYVQIEKGHGRLERRQIITSPDLNDYLRRDWGEVGQVFRRHARTRKPRPTECRGSLWLDQSFAPALFPATSVARDSCALGRGKSAPLAPRCHLGGRSLWRPLPASGSNAGGAQHRRALIDGSASRCQRRSPNPALRLLP